jgi:putative flippase GtrA
MGNARRNVRYLIAGGWNALFGYAAFALLCRVAAAVGVHYLFALGASQLLATTNAYLSYKHFVFKTEGPWLREYFRFSSVYWVMFAVNVAALPALIHVSGLGPVPAQGVILAVTVIASYLAHSRFSFAAAKR